MQGREKIDIDGEVWYEKLELVQKLCCRCSIGNGVVGASYENSKWSGGVVTEWRGVVVDRVE